MLCSNIATCAIKIILIMKFLHQNLILCIFSSNFKNISARICDYPDIIETNYFVVLAIHNWIFAKNCQSGSGER